MSRTKLSELAQRGFTLVEILIVMSLSAILAIILFTFYNSSLKTYLPLHDQSMAFSELSVGAERVANVLRGVTNINQATADEIDCYAYFSPQDNYVSVVKYYKSGGSLFVDVTPMTANPPIGTPITAQKKTYRVITKLYEAPGVSTFTYIDASNSPMTMPITNLNDIKAIKVTLGTPVTNPGPGDDTISLQVSLRNRKTNL